MFIHLPKGLQEIMGSYQFNLINLVSYDLPHQFPESQYLKQLILPKKQDPVKDPVSLE